MPTMAGLVKLVDGREVSTDSREWADECLARHVARMTSGTRSDWLASFERRHGPVAHQALLATMEQVFKETRG